MSRRHYNLPPLTTLAAFEAAARHLSFKNAAQELSVTPGAVSHQVKALEAELQAPLFQRKHRGVELTEEGEALFETLASSFSKISLSLKTIRDRQTGDTVTIGSTSAVASLWLSPSVVRFWRQHPDVNVNQIVNDRPLRSMPDVDFYIRYGRERDTRLEQAELYRDHLVPVGNAELAEKLTGCPLEELARQRLLHLESDDRSWTTWTDWFQQLGYSGPIAPGVRVNNYAVALQAAQDGVGLVLGWQRLLHPLLTTGQLVPIGPHVLAAPHGFHLVGRPDADLSESARLLRNWVIDEVNRNSGESS
ncbi:LysR family transcriptional regulator [Leisingera daeponensis]|uniref:LysR family transcriptional regulator n=1 Tax=Leisingera daeponensis TaxID=405746 RepID=A0ABS7NJ17_9RHOB|nr:LysR substrate-binding domain-containing protein [Leisingera daeponensis]MBY6058228.1 LysR family transcriptional regulator [Leisingera daeponensis]MBY6141193.1 LysR family transcriptional regulator [Leisingera daeponensis]